MLGYYLELAICSLRRNVALTVLMVAAVGVGIGASMTMLTTLLAMSADPIPDKSAQLFVPQIDVTGYGTRHHEIDNLPLLLPYRDAMALTRAQRGARQAEMYALTLNVKPVQGDPFPAAGRATDHDFFAMFEVPFRSGAAWGPAEDQDRANVVVLGARLAEHLFQGGESIGHTVNLGNKDYRVIGVLRPWTPVPRFYDVVSTDPYAESDDFYLPFATAIDRRISTSGYAGCEATEIREEWDVYLNSDCAWVQFWVELPTARQVADFKSWLQNYAAQQQQLGRFQWLPNVALRNVTEWLSFMHIVPNEARVDSMIATGFLIVCLINAIGLMLAKFSGRAMELSVRRALGASRADLFRQCLVETMVLGVLGGLLGLALTAAGLAALRGMQGVADPNSAAGHLVSLNGAAVAVTIAVAVVATICSGLYPAIRASRVQPGWQLKVQ